MTAWNDEGHDLLDNLIRRLEQAWQAGGTVDLGAFIPAPGHPARQQALLALIQTDQELRWQRGQPKTVDEYLETWSDLRERPECVAELYESEQRLRVESRIGRYEIRARLGSGGMGTVYRAFDTQLEREVALKIPACDPHREPKVVERFLQEGRAAARIQHPNVCPIYDAGCSGGTYFLVMALIEGKCLTEWIQEHSPAPEEIAELVRKLAVALQVVHDQGIVHRDIKPSNVMVTPQGEPLLMDFGLARRLDGAGGQTGSGVLAGTIAYMSPEQVNGKPADPRSDVYSLGVVFYQLLAGQLPFEGGLTDLLLRIRQAEPASPTSLRPGLNPLLESICLTAMAKEPSDRYQSAAELAAALQTYLARSSDEAAPAAPAASPSRTRGRPAFLIALGLCGVALLAGAIVLRIRDRSGRETVVEVPAGSKAKVGPNGEVEIGLAGAQGDLHTKPPPDAGDAVLSAVAERRQAFAVAGDEPNMSLLPRRLETPGVGRWHIETRLPRSEIRNVSWSPDGRLVACRSFDGVRMYEAANGRVYHIFSNRPRLCIGSDLSPNGKWMALHYDNGNDVRLWEVGSGKAGPVFTSRGQFGSQGAWSPDSQRLAVYTNETFSIWTVAGNLEHSWVYLANQWLCGWSRDGEWLLIVNGGGSGSVVRSPDGKPGPEIEEGLALAKQFRPQSSAWSPNGRYFAAEMRISNKGSFLWVWDTATWRLIRKSDDLKSWIHSPGWTPDSQRIIFSRHGAVAGRPRTEAWNIHDDSFTAVMAKEDVFAGSWALSPKGDEIVELFNNQILFWDVGAGKPKSKISANRPADVKLLSVSPDGQWLATKCLDRPTCFLWHGDGRPGPVMQKLSEGLTALAWGPDGRLASGHEKTVRVWNVNNGDLAWEWRGLEQAATILAWSPDGKHLASSGADKIIHVWDVDQSRHFQTAAAHPGTVDQLAWNSDSTKIASLSRAENCVRLWNADATAGPVLSVGESSARQFAWTPDIQQIAVLPEKGVLRLFNTAGEKVLEVPNADAFVEWSPDGKWLAAGSYQHPNFTGLRIFSRDGAGRPGPRLEFWEIDSEAFWRPDWRRWSPDGKWLAVNHVHDATVRLWDVKANRYSPVLEGNPKPCSAVCWSSDSQHLLTFNEDQTFRYWDVGSGRILATTVFLPNEQWARITDDGRVEVSGPEAEKELVYVLEDSSGAQKIYSVAEFRALAAKQTATSR